VKLILRAGGVLRGGPEKTLVDDYLTRAEGLARGTGFRSVEEQAVELKGQYARAAETAKLSYWMNAAKVRRHARLPNISPSSEMTAWRLAISLSAGRMGSSHLW